MLHIYNSDRVEPLATTLAGLLKTPLADPMAPEVVVIPTAGMKRWLGLELARSLGATNEGRTDGIAANIDFWFPLKLRRAVLDASLGDDATAAVADPWQVDLLAWVVLDVLALGSEDPYLKQVTDCPAGATLFSRARRIADLFDRYMTRRPRLIMQWVNGQDLNATGSALGEHALWQPHLWRLVRERIAKPSPPERLPELLAGVKAGRVLLDLPQRLSMFGLTTLPNGEQFIDLVEAIAEHRDVHLLMLDPSPGVTQKIRSTVSAHPDHTGLLRAADTTSELVLHPLLRSWGRPYRERETLLAVAGPTRVPNPTNVAPTRPTASPTTLLRQIQQDLTDDLAPARNFRLSPADRSIQIHSCHGRMRQVEVLRDSILHLLNDDPTLREEDIVVLCPDINNFAQLVEAGFGRSAEYASSKGNHATPPLLYRVADRSLRDSVPVLAALATLLELVSSKCTKTELFDFMSSSPVMERFNFAPTELSTIDSWIGETNIRWGLDGAHRSRWDLPLNFTQNSWHAAVDRILIGVALNDDDLTLGLGDIAPLEIEESNVALAGRFAEFIFRLTKVTHSLERSRPVKDWCHTITEACELLFDVPQAEQLQLDRVLNSMADLADGAAIGEEAANLPLGLSDINGILHSHLAGQPRRADFYRGGVTVTSLTPLRWLPFRVVCLLGLDDEATRSGASLPDGDDLLAIAPVLGDRDPRSETRQSLLEALLAAGDYLIITRNGHDLQKNNPVPPAVVVAELRDTIIATLAGDGVAEYKQKISTVHPRQPFDPKCFTAGELGTDNPWGFDSNAFAGAEARLNQDMKHAPALADRLGPADEDGRVLTAQQLKSFMADPIGAFARQRLNVSLPAEVDATDDNLPTDINALEKWHIADRLLAAVLAGHDLVTWERHETALGTLPVGGLAEGAVAEAVELVDNLLSAADEHGVLRAVTESHPFDIVINDTTRLVGEVANRLSSPSYGPALITCSKQKPKDLLDAWLDLLCLVATYPDRDFKSVVIGRSTKSKSREAQTAVLSFPNGAPEERQRIALEALKVVVDCYDRGMREPLPLFATVSKKLSNNESGLKEWKTFEKRGDGDKAVVKYFFGDFSYKEVLDLPALEHDPHDPEGDDSGRLRRYANYFWGAFNMSCTEMT